MKKKAIIITAIGLALAICAGVIIFAVLGKDSREIAKNLDLGNKYLTEQNYEEAVAAFNKVLEIDPMNVDAYVGLAEIYVCQYKIAEEVGDLKSAVLLCETAVEILQQGYELVKNEKLVEIIDELRNEISRIQKALEDRSAEETPKIETVVLSPEEQEEQRERELFDYFMDEIEIFGLTMRDYLEMSQEDLCAYAVNKYELYELADGYWRGSNDKQERYVTLRTKHSMISYVEWRRISESAAEEIPFVQIRKENGEDSGAWCVDWYDFDNFEKYVEFPEDFFSLDASVDEIYSWFMDRGVECEKDGNSISVTNNKIDTFYLISINEYEDNCWLFFYTHK